MSRFTRSISMAPHTLRVLLTAFLLVCVPAGVAGAQQDAAGQQKADESSARGEGYPESWYYLDPVTNERFIGVQELEGGPAPWLKGGRWQGQPQELTKLRGKVVVLNFWSAACGECLLDIRKNNNLAKTYADEPFVMVGVHHRSDGVERYDAVVRQFNPPYSMCVDTLGSTYRAWRVDRLPTYAVIDKHGVVRAIGIKQQRIDDVVEPLLEEEFDPAAVVGRQVDYPQQNRRAEPDRPKAEVPEQWLEGNAKSRARFDELLAKDAPPAIESDTWLNTEPLKLEELTGKVVMLDFWGTWCAPCIRSIPKINELHEKYEDDGLVIIGVCDRRNVEKMGEVVERHGISYPVCADADGTLCGAYKVRGYPDYYFIDRSGELRIADCRNGSIEDAIRMLLAEPAPGDPQDVGRLDTATLRAGDVNDEDDDSSEDAP